MSSVWWIIINHFATVSKIIQTSIIPRKYASKISNKWAHVIDVLHNSDIFISKRIPRCQNNIHNMKFQNCTLSMSIFRMNIHYFHSVLHHPSLLQRTSKSVAPSMNKISNNLKIWVSNCAREYVRHYQYANNKSMHILLAKIPLFSDKLSSALAVLSFILSVEVRVCLWRWGVIPWHYGYISISQS